MNAILKLIGNLFLSGLTFLCVILSITVTQGQTIKENDRIAIVGNAFADLMHLNGYFETLLRHRCASQKIRFRNFGWAGDTVIERTRPTNFDSEDKWLNSFKADLVIVCVGMPESFGGDGGLLEFRQALNRLLKHYQSQKYNSESPPRLILVSPTAHEDVGLKGINVKQRNKDLKKYTDGMEAIADVLNIPFIDLFTVSHSLMVDKDGSQLTTNGMHLNAYGYWAVSQLLTDQIVPRSKPLRIQFDFNGGLGQSQGGAINDIRQDENGLNLNIEVTGWPILAAPDGSRIHDSLKNHQDQVLIHSLPGGEHTLSFSNGQSITATAKQWSQGVCINSTNRHLELERYRLLVNEKNLKYFHCWRALNQVHIVGERKKSPSGRTLPEELSEWSRLATEDDKRLSTILQPSKNIIWNLAPKEKK